MDRNDSGSATTTFAMGHDHFIGNPGTASFGASIRCPPIKFSPLRLPYTKLSMDPQNVSFFLVRYLVRVSLTLDFVRRSSHSMLGALMQY